MKKSLIPDRKIRTQEKGQKILKKWGIKVNFFDLKIGKNDFPIKFDCLYLWHSDPCVGYRLYLEGKIITYCTDTGLCPNFYKLAKNADILITEAGTKKKSKSNDWPHLWPEGAAGLAKEVNVKDLYFTHFGGDCCKTQKDRLLFRNKARKIFMNTFATFDGLEIKI